MFTGELKLAQRQISMVELSAIIDSIDKNGDGKLTYDEVKAVLKQVGGKVIHSMLLECINWKQFILYYI